MQTLGSLLALLALVGSAGCGTAPPDEAPPRTDTASIAPTDPRAEEARADPLAPRADGEDYVFVYLLTGPRGADADPEAVREAMAGHFANMQRLAAEELLLVAGPFSDPRLDPRHRGIFLFDVAEVARGRELAASDPAIRAGLLEPLVLPFRCGAALRSLPARERAAGAAREARGEDAFEGVPYVLVRAPEAQGAVEALAPFVDEGLVLLWGRLGGEGAGDALFLLDLASADEAHELLQVAAGTVGREIDWQVSPWYSSSVLRELGAGPGRER